MAKLCCQVFLQHRKSWKFLLISKERSVVKSQDPIYMYNSMLAFISLGAKVNELVTRGTGPYSFHV